LIDILISADGPNEAWGIAASARLLLAADRAPTLKPKPSSSAQQKIDIWLAKALAQGGKDFETNLELAAAAGSQNSNVSEAARFLLHRPDNTFGRMHLWELPEYDEAWYTRMRTDPEVKAVVETFVRDALPLSRDSFGSEFVMSAERMAPDLTPAFLAAALEAVHLGLTNTSDTISEGALRDLAGFEAVVDAAIAVRTPSEAERQRYAEIQLSIDNAEYSDDYAEHLSESEDGWTAGEFLEAYVQRVRKTIGWQPIAEHRHRGPLRYYWLRELAKVETPDPEEVSGAFDAGCGTDDEDDVWRVASKAWLPTFEDVLVERLIEGHSIESVRTAALTCLVLRAADRLPLICGRLSRKDREPRLLDLMIELGTMNGQESHFGEPEETKAAGRAITTLPPLLREISEAASALEKRIAPVLSEAAQRFVIQAQNPSEQLRLFRVSLDRHLPMFIPDDVRWLLSNTEVATTAIAAIDCAVRHSMAEEIETGLSHRFADVVAHSLRAIASEMEAPLPSTLLALASHKGSPVRLALVDLIATKPHSEHLPTLLVLAKDEWSSRSSQYYEDNGDYPIARAAVAVIAQSEMIDDGLSDELYRLAIDTSDPDIRFDVFALLVRIGPHRFQAQLLDLAVTPGRPGIRVQAAAALLATYERIEDAIVAKITPTLLSTRIVGVASRLLLLVTIRAEIADVVRMAEALATNANRRVLLLLAIWILHERDPAAADQIAKLLPLNHAGISSARAGWTTKLAGSALDDLGDPASVEEVFSFIRKAPSKSK